MGSAAKRRAPARPPERRKPWAISKPALATGLAVVSGFAVASGLAVVSGLPVASGLAPRWVAQQPQKTADAVSLEQLGVLYGAAAQPNAGQARSPQQACSPQEAINRTNRFPFGPPAECCHARRVCFRRVWCRLVRSAPSGSAVAGRTGWRRCSGLPVPGW